MADPHVWVKVGHGRTRRMLKSVALAGGYEIDTRPPVGLGRGDFGVRREFMTQKEREEIFRKTGAHVEDREGMRRVFKERGLRESEPGEECHARIDAMLESAKSGKPLDPRHGFGSLDLYGERARDEARAARFNIHERFRYHANRLGLPVSS